MHTLWIDPAVAHRARQRRGSDFAFERIDCPRTALLAIDAQNWVMDPESPVYMPGAETLAPRINTVAQALRRAGGRVIWVQMEATAESVAGWPVFYDSLVRGARDAFMAAMRPGSHWHALYPALDVHREDLLCRKTRYSCLLQCSSDLDVRLRYLGLDTLLIAGFATNVCCDSTARDAMMMGYKVIVLSDACGCRSEWEHNASLSNLLNMFADVRSCASTNELLAASGSAAPEAPEAPGERADPPPQAP